ncbi:MAG: hypothetical protein V3T74_04010 [Gemmatimonadales bacterium]
MKNLGYLLIVAGFLAGALVSVLDEELVGWTLYAVALAVGVTGIVIVRTVTHRQAREGGRLARGMEDIDASLDRIVANIRQLNAQKADLHPYDVRTRIDELFPDDINTFVEARASIGHVHGLQAYAEVMNYFSAGERYLNRVWSASADGYVDEIDEYLGRSQVQFAGAQEQVRLLEGKDSA